MVVISVIGILAAIALPYFKVYLLKGHLSQAQPYLMQIASKERMYKVRTGGYFISSGNDEQHLRDNLGVDLRDASDFCFVVVCKASCVNETGVAATSAVNYVAAAEAGDTAIEFEVWALLRRITGGVNGAGTSCTVQTNKLSPNGWVQESGLGAEGRMVVLRYPPPRDGIDAVGNYRGILSDWNSGISFSDALKE